MILQSQFRAGKQHTGEEEKAFHPPDYSPNLKLGPECLGQEIPHSCHVAVGKLSQVLAIQT